MTPERTYDPPTVKQMYRDINKESEKMNDFVCLQPVANEYEVYPVKVRKDAAISWISRPSAPWI